VDNSLNDCDKLGKIFFRYKPTKALG